MKDKNEVDASASLQDVEIREDGDLVQSTNSGLPLMLPPEPGISKRLGELQGKFWTGPKEMGQTVDMEDDIEEDSTSLGSLDSKFHCLNRLGFDDYAFVPSIGRSGGLIMAWKSNRADVQVLQTDRQFIHIRCSLVGTTEFLLTAVYAIPNSALKALLWQELSRLSSLISLPWVVIGDLNDILQSTERTGGSLSSL
ncbi:hypothetical protein K1719_011525 [Acacia pycnantha]|nr:hypothetical protein K1719_011525 [Acacia pycnantha]